MTTHFRVDRYRIDLYFTDHKIAVECDKHGHVDRDPQAEVERQAFITKQLNCQWVRYNPHHKDFDIMKVVNQVLCKIMH